MIRYRVMGVDFDSSGPNEEELVLADSMVSYKDAMEIQLLAEKDYPDLYIWVEEYSTITGERICDGDERLETLNKRG